MSCIVFALFLVAHGLIHASFHPWVVLGFAIDAVLLWLVLGARWTAEVAGP